MTRRLRARGGLAAIAVVSVLGMFATGPVGASSADRAVQQADGGTLRIAAEQELATANWISSSGGLSWGNWSLGIHTLPQAFTILPDGSYRPSDVLAGEPVLEEGPPQKVTYTINPAAVWTLPDGTTSPVVSEDFKYLWEEIVNGKDIYDPTGYTSIESIDTTDPAVAVVTFSEPYAAWRDLFGGFYFLLPSVLLEGKNLDKETKDGYAFSGGPWKMEGGKKGWKKGRSITLVPNENFWGTKPTISKVIFQFIIESPAQTQAVKTGQVLAAYPQPQEGILDELEENANLEYVVSLGNVYEGFWLNESKFPLDSQAVRQALMAATDRKAIVDGIILPAVREGSVLESFVMPTFPTFFTPAFEAAGYAETADLAKVDELMTGDGWEKGSDGIWAKDGRKAELQIQTTAGNEARELTEELWQSQLQTAGFLLEIKNPSATVLFGTNGPKGRFQVGLYAQVGTPDPGLCLVFCSKNIPTKKNGFVGQNWTRTDDPTIDETWGVVDVTLDPTARAVAAKAGQAALADHLVAIPLYQKPNVFVWDSSKISGPLEDNPTNGPFWNLNLWQLTG